MIQKFKVNDLVILIMMTNVARYGDLLKIWIRKLKQIKIFCIKRIILSFMIKKGMNLIEKLNPGNFKNYLNKYDNTICGRHPISVLLNVSSNYFQF